LEGGSLQSRFLQSEFGLAAAAGIDPRHKLLKVFRLRLDGCDLGPQQFIEEALVVVQGYGVGLVGRGHDYPRISVGPEALPQFVDPPERALPGQFVGAGVNKLTALSA